jgi:hypothetical protein
MGSDLAKSFRRVEAILDRSNNTNFTFARGSIALICGSSALCSKCGARTGEARWPNQKAGPSILCFRSSKFIKEKLYKIGEGLENGLQSLTNSVLTMYIDPQFSPRH